MMEKSLQEKTLRFAVVGATPAKGKKNSRYGCSQSTAENAEYQMILWPQ